MIKNSNLKKHRTPKPGNQLIPLALLTALACLVYGAKTAVSHVNNGKTTEFSPNYTSDNYISMDLEYAALNCNSLNMSSATKPAQMKKIYAIAKLKTDIIFLSDLRLSKSKHSDLKTLQSNFATNPYCSYKLIHNSTKNKRGTGILIKNGIGLSEITRESDPDENFLAVLIENSNGQKVIAVAIYGPNHNDAEFFNRIKIVLETLGPYPTIIGGDWNCTYSTESINTNIDCCNMSTVPNAAHSLLLNNLCTDRNLTDLYRYLWPNKQEYTYIPRNKQNKNRSRIDFFKISNCLLPNLKKILYQSFSAQYKL